MAQGLLGRLTHAEFLHQHWQKRPLFVRGAIPDCGVWLQPDALFEWAARDEVESRLVIKTRGRWTVQHGPFAWSRARWRRMPARDWTLLVQGVEQHHAEAARLLQRFSFIPHTRLDDLMVSYAPPGGGVGPHFDSYDVFLLQGAGTRRWRINEQGAQRDCDLLENAPLRILKRFHPTREWTSERGDLLYLPPRCAHEGVALDACLTLSVGFRAPRAQELATRFLEYLQDELQLPGIYQDRGLPLQKHPAQLPPMMLEKFSRLLERIRWSDSDVRHFCGRYLSEPKAQTVFRRPCRPAPLPAFARRVAARGVRLVLPARMLFSGRHFYINGEHHRCDGPDRAQLMRLADRRETGACAPSAATLRLLHAWYCAGYLDI